MKTDFNFVDPVYDEIFAREKEKSISRVIYFGTRSDLEEVKGKITGNVKNDLNEEFLSFETGEQVRIDRIISINGIPGPAFQEYDNYGMACLDCS
jgi:hypothetical protein